MTSVQKRYILAALAFAPLAGQAQTNTWAPTAGQTSTAYGFGSANARHTQQLYQPGQLFDSTAGPQTINRIYLRRGALALAGVTLDSLQIRFGQTSRHNFRQAPNLVSYYFEPAPQILYEADEVFMAGGSEESWYAITPPAAIPYDPSKSLILDIRFLASDDATWGLEGSTRLGPTQRVYAADRSDSTGSASTILPHLGLDLLTAIEPTAGRTVAAYPNPATASVRFQLPQTSPASVELIGIDGRRHSLGEQPGQAAFTLPGGLASGVYQARIRQDGKTYGCTLSVR